MGTGLDGNLDESTQGKPLKFRDFNYFNFYFVLGLIPRSVKYLMEKLQSQYGAPQDNSSNPGTFFEIYTSFLEIYNEEIIDLLAPTLDTHHHATRAAVAAKRKSFSIREDAKGEIYLTGIREEKIVSDDEIFALLQKGSLSRTTKSTEMNMVSSRSHAIFTLLLRQRREDGAKVLASKLHFVDLAGSERLKRTQAQGDRVKESISINSGLLALGNVISALGDPHKRSTHIPYRNSKLTRLLQDSLGGNSQTLMIACASPSSDNFAESLNTLKYADRAKNIQNMVMINEEIGGNGAFEVAQLKKQIAALKQEILHLRTSRRSESVEDVASGGNSVLSAAAASVASKPNPRDQAELTRLRSQNSELKHRVTQMAKEKATIEAERDAFKAAAGPAGAKAAASQHVKMIAELKGRIAELESTASINAVPVMKPSASAVSALASHSAATSQATAPQTPVWLRQANALVNKARDEIRENLQTIRKIEFENANCTAAHSAQPVNLMELDDEPMTPSMTPSKSHASMPLLLNHPIPFSLSQHSLPSTSGSSGSILQLTQAQFAAAVATRCESLMSRVRSDLALKEDLIRQFEICQAEYSSMRRHYDEKMRLVQENLLQSQKERDLAIKKATNGANGSSNPAVGPAITLTNRRYEERIKALGKELNAARAAANESQRSMQSRAMNSDASMKSLRAQLETMRTEKSKLLARLAEETSRLKNDCFAHDSELIELRQREYRANESARKLKKAYDFQKALLAKRIEQNQQARNKIRQLLLALKKQRSGSLGVPNDEIDFSSEGIGNDSMEQLTEIDLEMNTGIPAAIPPENSQASHDVHPQSDDDEILLQLNEQTEAVLNEEINMMEIDPISCGEDESIEDLQGAQSIKPLAAYKIEDSQQTGEVPRSALRHSPLVSRRRDVFAKLEENKKNPFK